MATKQAATVFLVNESDPTRYRQLIVLAFMGASGTLCWLSTAARSNTLAAYFGVSTFWFQAANASFYFGALISVPLVFYLVNLEDFRIRKLAIFASSCILIGAFIRMFSVFQSPVGFAILCLGNLVVGLSAGVTIGLAIHNTMVWFALSEQTTATGLTLGGSGIGSSCGYTLGTLMILNSSNWGMWLGMNGIILFFALLAFILVFIYTFDIPSTLPSIAATKIDAELKRLGTTKAFFTEGLYKYSHAYFWVFIVQCSVCGVPVYFTIQTTLQTNMADQNFTSTQQDVAGNLFVWVGLIGTIGWSALVDRFKIYQVGSIVSWAASVLMLALLGVRITTDYLGTEIATLYVISSIASICFSSVPPIALQLACNMVYPMPSILITVSIFFLAQVFTPIVLFSSQALGGKNAWYELFALLTVGFILSITNYWAPLRRTEFEEQQRLQLRTGSSLKRSRRKHNTLVVCDRMWSDGV